MLTKPNSIVPSPSTMDHPTIPMSFSSIGNKGGTGPPPPVRPIFTLILWALTFILLFHLPKA